MEWSKDGWFLATQYMTSATSNSIRYDLSLSKPKPETPLAWLQRRVEEVTTLAFT